MSDWRDFYCPVTITAEMLKRPSRRKRFWRWLKTGGVYGRAPDGRRLNTRATGTIHFAASSLAQAQEAMGMDWADWHGTKEAIPPAYSEFIGTQLLAHFQRFSSLGEERE